MEIPLVDPEPVPLIAHGGEGFRRLLGAAPDAEERLPSVSAPPRSGAIPEARCSGGTSTNVDNSERMRRIERVRMEISSGLRAIPPKATLKSLVSGFSFMSFLTPSSSLASSGSMFFSWKTKTIDSLLSLSVSTRTPASPVICARRNARTNRVNAGSAGRSCPPETLRFLTPLTDSTARFSTTSAG